MSVSETSQFPIAYVAFGTAASAAVVSAIVGGNAVAKIAFGIPALAGTRDLSLLPLTFFYKEKRMARSSRFFFESSAIAAVGYIGLYAITDANLLNYTIPAIALTWLLAGPIIYKQGIPASLNEEGRDDIPWVFGPLHVDRERLEF